MVAYKVEKQSNKSVMKILDNGIVIIDGIKMRKCAYCGKLFEYDEKFPNKVLCSKECREKAIRETPKSRRRTERRFCAYCGKPFIWKSSAPDQIYCSTKCEDKAEKDRLNETDDKDIIVERRCAYCGKKFEWVPQKAAQKYCCDKCRMKASKQRQDLARDMKDPFLKELRMKVADIVTDMISRSAKDEGKLIDYNLSSWEGNDIPKDVREAVFERDFHQCRICGRKNSLDIHHISRKNGFEYELKDNMVTLCSSCHRHIETGNIPFAIEKCYSNAKSNYNDEKKVNRNSLPSIKLELEDIFRDLKNTDLEDVGAILTDLDDIIERISD